MRNYLVYIASPERINIAIKILEKANAECYNKEKQKFKVRNRVLGAGEFCIHLISDLAELIPALRHDPIDMLIYDERGRERATRVIEKIRRDVKSLVDLFGPDYFFPIGRMVAILESGEESSHDAFRLGKERVGATIVDPHHFSKVIKTIIDLLENLHKQKGEKVALSLSGGGLEGLLFQAGCVYALDLALAERRLFDMDAFAGVSSGSIVASIISAGIPIEEFAKALCAKSQVVDTIGPLSIYDFAFDHIIKRFLSVTPHVFQKKWLQSMLKAVPTGFCKGNALRHFIHNGLVKFGIEDNFASLSKPLYIGATLQNTFEPVILGVDPWDHIRISDAVRASCALPPVFTPHKIDGVSFVDGQVNQSSHLEHLVQGGSSLIFIVDPMKPFTTFEPHFVEQQGGIFSLLQTVKTLIHSRFMGELGHLRDRYPDVDFLVFEPYEECARLMSGSPMKLSFNLRILELAYKGTLRRLRERHHYYGTKLSRYGFKLVSERILLNLERDGIAFLK